MAFSHMGHVFSTSALDNAFLMELQLQQNLQCLHWARSSATTCLNKRWCTFLKQYSKGHSLDTWSNLSCNRQLAICRRGKEILDLVLISLLASLLLSLFYPLPSKESKLKNIYLIFILRSKGNDGPCVCQSFKICSHGCVYTFGKDIAGMFWELEYILGDFIPQ